MLTTINSFLTGKISNIRDDDDSNFIFDDNLIIPVTNKATFKALETYLEKDGNATKLVRIQIMYDFRNLKTISF